MKNPLNKLRAFSLLMASALIASAPAAQARLANLELRAPIGALLTPLASGLNEGLAEELKVKNLLSFGADALILAGSDSPDFLRGWGAGVRFDSLTSFRIYNDDRLEVAANIFSLMGHRRWALDDNAYIGPTATAGFYLPGVINYKRAPANWERFEAGRTQSFTLGAEGGWIWDVFVVSFELGYQYLKMENFTAHDGTRLQTPNGVVGHIDFSGPYAKFLLGIHF